MAAMYQLLAEDCGDVLATFAYAVYKQHKVEVMHAMYRLRAEAALQNFLDETLGSRKRELEENFTTTKIGAQLQAIQMAQNQKRSWKGWAADVSGNLAVNFVTILVIAALLFGFRRLDQMLNEFGRNSSVLSK